MAQLCGGPGPPPVAWALVLGTTLASAREALVVETPTADVDPAARTVAAAAIGTDTRHCLRQLMGATASLTLPDTGNGRRPLPTLT